MKPKLSLKAARLFHQIVAYVRQYNICKHSGDRVQYFALENAASDVMDGLCEPHDPEVKELKAKGIILSAGRTWILTPYAVGVICNMAQASKGITPNGEKDASRGKQNRQLEPA